MLVSRLEKGNTGISTEMQNSSPEFSIRVSKDLNKSLKVNKSIEEPLKKGIEVYEGPLEEKQSSASAVIDHQEDRHS